MAMAARLMRWIVALALSALMMSLAPASAAEARKANVDATVVEAPGLNHLLQTATSGGLGEYARIEETMAPAALNTIANWVVAHTKR
jgi:hypothetical protein